MGDPAVSHQERDASLLQRQSRVQQHGLHQVQQQDSPKTDSHGLDFSNIQIKLPTPVIPKHAANCLFCDSKFLFKKCLTSAKGCQWDNFNNSHTYGQWTFPHTYGQSNL